MKSQRQIISRIPQRGMTGEQWSLVVENELLKIWVKAMSPTERKGFEGGGLASVSPAGFAKLDEIILHQAETLGWRIELSKLVQFRKSEWDLDPKGPEKHRKFGMAVAKSARIMQRKELPPLEDPDQWLVKKETVEELRLLLEQLRAAVAMRRNSPSAEKVRHLFSTTVADSPESFPHLAANLERWQKFHEERPFALVPLTTRKRAAPAALYDEFLSWSTGWETEALRQAISQLGRAKL
jgi:hypothetical protein